MDHSDERVAALLTALIAYETTASPIAEIDALLSVRGFLPNSEDDDHGV